MIFRQKLKQGLIKPEATKEGPLCMDTYRYAVVYRIAVQISDLTRRLDGCLIVVECPGKDMTGVSPMLKQETKAIQDT